MAHKITRKMIAPELRFVGTTLRWAMPYFSEPYVKISNKILRFIERRHSGYSPAMAFTPVEIPRTDGSGNLRMCIYYPIDYDAKESKGVPGLLWIHGGGYGLGVPEIDEGFIRDFILEYPCVVVSPDYRLSIDVPYPAALEDCYDALVWLRDNVEPLGVDENQIFIGGESAGGGLTAATCIYARDMGEVSVAFQMPLYPMLDDRPHESSTGNDSPVWNTKSSEAAWKLYLRDGFRSEDLTPYAAPGRLEDFTGLPPAFTFVGSIEPFHDETVEYFAKLKAAGVEAECHVFDGCFHAFDMVWPRAKVSKKARKMLMEAYLHASMNYRASQPVSDS